jgi:hypothetical protein
VVVQSRLNESHKRSNEIPIFIQMFMNCSISRDNTFPKIFETDPNVCLLAGSPRHSPNNCNLHIVMPSPRLTFMLCTDVLVTEVTLMLWWALDPMVVMLIGTQFTNGGQGYSFATSMCHSRSNLVWLLVYDGMCRISRAPILYYRCLWIGPTLLGSS